MTLKTKQNKMQCPWSRKFGNSAQNRSFLFDFIANISIINRSLKERNVLTLALVTHTLPFQFWSTLAHGLAILEKVNSLSSICFLIEYKIIKHTVMYSSPNFVKSQYFAIFALDRLLFKKLNIKVQVPRILYFLLYFVLFLFFLIF